MVDKLDVPEFFSLVMELRLLGFSLVVTPGSIQNTTTFSPAMKRFGLPLTLTRSAAGQARQEGMALLVIMVVFVVLYLVIYQLHFSTKMEEHIAQSRYGEAESQIAFYSAGLFVITHLVEDLTKDSRGSGDALGTALGAETEKPRQLTDPGGKSDELGKLTSLKGAGTAGGGGSGKAHDSLYENIFNANQQQVGDTSVKIVIEDGERKFDLNWLFDYARIRGEEVEAGAAALTEDDAVAAVGNATSEADASKRLEQTFRQRTEERRAKKKGGSGTTAAKEAGGIARVDEGGATEDGTTPESVAAMSDYENPEFESPDPVRIEETKKMVERAILMMISINENNYGRIYKRAARYDAGAMAQRIVDYVLERRSATYQNRVFLITELLNLCSESGEEPGDVTPEIFYGPYPRLVDDEVYPVGDAFVLKRDEFGDIIPEYQYGDEESGYREDEKQQIAALEEQFGRFMDFGGMGFSRLMGNALTRGMQELPIEEDQNGEEYVVEVPRLLGLRDLFTTYSTGKININTASVPILYSLLLSLSDGPGGEAELVAFNIRDWRARFKVEEDENGIKSVDPAKDRKTSREKRDEKRKQAQELAPASGAALDPTLMDQGLESSYEDLDLNYFTSLDQLELIDGVDGGPTDVLQKDQGVERVSAEDDTLYRRVIHDLEKVAVFSSTYFNAELKAKPKEGRSIKTGYLTLRRDLKKRMVDVVLWKNQQK